jgi:hypothetical protein
MYLNSEESVVAMKSLVCPCCSERLPNAASWAENLGRSDINAWVGLHSHLHMLETANCLRTRDSLQDLWNTPLLLQLLLRASPSTQKE